MVTKSTLWAGVEFEFLKGETTLDDWGKTPNLEDEGVLPRDHSTLIFVECSVSSAL